MTLKIFDNICWKKGIHVKCFGRGKEWHLTVINVNLITRKVLTEKGWYFREFVEIEN